MQGRVLQVEKPDLLRNHGMSYQPVKTGEKTDPGVKDFDGKICSTVT